MVCRLPFANAPAGRGAPPVADPSVSVVCYPRDCDSVAFYLGRDDLHGYRSNAIDKLRKLVREQPRTVILCTHRHSREQLHQLLPPEVRIVEEVHVGLEELPGVPASLRKGLAALMGETALGLSDLAVVECTTHKHFTVELMKVRASPFTRFKARAGIRPPWVYEYVHPGLYCSRPPDCERPPLLS